MSSKFLSLRLEAPMQSWGASSKFQGYRGTLPFPTRSGVLGMVCAALGLDRGSQGELEFLDKVKVLKMKVFSSGSRPTSIIEDYHTVSGASTPKGKVRSDVIITRRSYLVDAKFAVVFQGDSELLEKISSAIRNPVWNMCLGRKSCIPTASVYTGRTMPTEAEALSWCKEPKLIVEEIPLEQDGDDIIMDVPVSFLPRVFTSRKVRYPNANLSTTNA